MVGAKLCPMCKIVKSDDKFDKNPNKPGNGGLSYRCKECKKLEPQISRQRYNPNNLDPTDWIGKEEEFPNTSLLIKAKVKGSKLLVDCRCGTKNRELPKNGIMNMVNISCSYKCPYSRTNLKAVEAGKEFIQKAKTVHGDLYDYSLTHYKHSTKDVLIICKEHGDFPQTPAAHLGGAGCPSCTDSISVGEKEWLDYLGVPNIVGVNRNPTEWIGDKWYKPDGFDPTTNTWYEYHGDYFHGNIKRYEPDFVNPTAKKTMQELFEKTVRKSRAIRDAGYSLVSIWENEWDELKKTLPPIEATLDVRLASYWVAIKQLRGQ